VATSRVVWQGDRFTAQLRGVLQGRAQRAVNIIVGDTQRRISTPYPPASLPGQPPHLRSGRLFRSVSGDVRSTKSTITATVRATAPYADILDPQTRGGVRGAGGRFGKRKIARRPFIGLPQDIAKMARIMIRGA
jgi:hypothetical protein